MYDWLIGNLGTPGEYAYQAIHSISTATVLLAVAAVAILGRVKAVPKRKLLVGIALFQLGFEILWRLVYFFIKGETLASLWPMYPCNLGGVLVPVIALLDWKPGKKMFYLFGFVGGVLTFAIPDGIFTADVMSFPILKSILQHTGLLLIPVLEFADGTYRPSLRYFGWCVLGCIVHAINCEVIDRLLGFEGDYMYFRGDIPFVIPGVPQFITVSVFALAVFALLCYLSNPKDIKTHR